MPEPSRQSARRSPIVTSRIAVDDIVLVADGTGVFYGLIRGRTTTGFLVSPLEKLGERRRVRADAVADHWGRAERPRTVSALQLDLGLPDL